MKASLHLSRLITFVIGLALMISLLPTRSASAVSPDVVISQVYGGGGNSGGIYTNDFVELYNRGTTSISLDGWSIQYASATGTGNFGAYSNQLTPLSGSIAPGQYMLISEAAGTSCSGSPCGLALPTPDITDSTPISMSGTGGKVALVTSTAGLGCNGGSTPCSDAQLAMIKDLVGWDGANFYEGSGPAPATTNSTAVLRKSDGAQDTDNNADDFEAVVPNPRNSTFPFGAVGLATPNVLFTGDTTLLTVAVTPGANPTSSGLSVTCDLTEIGGPAAQAFYDDGSNGDDTAGDNTFSYSTTIAYGALNGPLSLACTITDDQSRTVNATINLTVTVILPIGTVQGSVTDSDDGATFASPYAGQTVTIQGVIYENILSRTNSGTSSFAFFVQNTVATADEDPNSSDGIYVYIGRYSNLRIKGGGYYNPTVGDEVILQGPISEYFNLTEIGNPYLLEVVRSGVVLDDEVPAFDVNPPVDLADANRYWERREGMRGQIPADSIVLNGRNTFASTADAEVWVARPDSDIALRTDPYTRRAFRDAHPLDDNYVPNSWDGNGYRILMGSLGIKADESDNTAMIAPARTFDTLVDAVTGGLYYGYSKYTIQVDQQVSFTDGVDPALNAPPELFDRAVNYTIADYNLENLYDFRDNPFSGCDFASDTGCPKVYPFKDSVDPSFDYVPSSDAAYQARLNDIALQIINDLHNPDILMVQEVENQDICTITDGAMVCGTTDNADGQPDDLQDLALKIASLGGPTYAAAFDRDSSDLRGILPAFMYRTDRVQLVDPTYDPLLGMDPTIGSYTGVPDNADVSNPKTLNAVYEGTDACETAWIFPRAPDIGLFRIYSESVGVGSYRDVYVINNHFKSGPDSCVAHRTEQAKYNAALVVYIQAANPYARIVVGGDLNVYPRPDDPFAPIGQPGASDQLGVLYNPSLGLTNLWDVLLGQVPEAAYSYVYVGMAQTLDQMFVNQTMLADLNQFRIAHINSDFPADYPGDVARGTSDHDPNVATFAINFEGLYMPIVNAPVINSVKAGQSVPIQFSLGSYKDLDIFATGYPLSQEIDCETNALVGNAEEIETAGSSMLTYDPTTDTYTLAWKTDKTWAGTCRLLTVMLNDGTVQQAIFQFTK